jgi:hypothetical protein
MAKARATTEELIKVLDYTLAEHQKNIEKSEKELKGFLDEFKKEIEKGQGINVKPDLTQLDLFNKNFSESVNTAEIRLKKSLQSIFISPFVLGLISVVFLSGVGLLAYSFNQLEKAKALENSQQRYINDFFEAKPKALELFIMWKKERERNK